MPRQQEQRPDLVAVATEPHLAGLVHDDLELWRMCGTDGKLMIAELVRIEGIVTDRPHRLRT
jgi:hypothetical protein